MFLFIFASNVLSIALLLPLVHQDWMAMCTGQPVFLPFDLELRLSIKVQSHLDKHQNNCGQTAQKDKEH